jgi:putative oxidoreductase
MFRWYSSIGGLGSVGLLVLRLVVGAAFLFHGWEKIRNPTTWMNAFPNPPPPYLQAAAAVAEFCGGISLIIGLLTPLFALLIACTMATAAFTVHIPHGDPFVNTKGGASWELAAVYFAASVAILLLGPGQLSLDWCLFGRRRASFDRPPYSNR